jgi:hypothetical protein
MGKATFRRPFHINLNDYILYRTQKAAIYMNLGLTDNRVLVKDNPHLLLVTSRQSGDLNAAAGRTKTEIIVNASI